jgi:hypothetical protein
MKYQQDAGTTKTIARDRRPQSLLTRDFMADGYALIDEPLNLRADGQRWFTEIYGRRREVASAGLVLGATPWLAGLLARTCHHTVMVDVSKAMLEHAFRELSSRSTRKRAPINAVQANWLQMPQRRDAIDIIVGDNAFSFLEYPNNWAQLRDVLSTITRHRGTLLLRVCSVPSSHRSMPLEELVAGFYRRDSLNYTEVRAALLFAHWNPGTFAIKTEEVLESFESNRRLFDPLLKRCADGVDNDLLTLRKYKRSGVVYYAPPLADILSLMGRSFRISSVNYGPYAMSQYFPLIVASKRDCSDT